MPRLTYLVIRTNTDPGSEMTAAYAVTVDAKSQADRLVRRLHHTNVGPDIQNESGLIDDYISVHDDPDVDIMLVEVDGLHSVELVCDWTKSRPPKIPSPCAGIVMYDVV